MEVVSPFSFARANQSGKRRFACSPIHDATTTNVAGVLESSEDFDMDDCSGFGFQATKRRRKLPNEGAENAFSQWSVSPFTASSLSGHLSPNSAGESREFTFFIDSC